MLILKDFRKCHRFGRDIDKVHKLNCMKYLIAGPTQSCTMVQNIYETS